LEEKIAALEQCGKHVNNSRVNDNIDHLEERLDRAEAELANIDHSQRSSEMQKNHKVSSFVTTSELIA